MWSVSSPTTALAYLGEISPLHNFFLHCIPKKIIAVEMNERFAHFYPIRSISFMILHFDFCILI